MLTSRVYRNLCHINWLFFLSHINVLSATFSGLLISPHYLRTNTHTRQNKHSRQTEAGPQIFRSTAGQKSAEWLSEGPRFKAPGAGLSRHSSPGWAAALLDYFSLLYVRVCWDADKEWHEQGKTQAFSFFSFLFSYAQNCFLFPIFFFFLFKGEGGARFDHMITIHLW